MLCLLKRRQVDVKHHQGKNVITRAHSEIEVTRNAVHRLMLSQHRHIFLFFHSKPCLYHTVQIHYPFLLTWQPCPAPQTRGTATILLMHSKTQRAAGLPFQPPHPALAEHPPSTPSFPIQSGGTPTAALGLLHRKDEGLALASLMAEVLMVARPVLGTWTLVLALTCRLRAQLRLCVVLPPHPVWTFPGVLLQIDSAHHQHQLCRQLLVCSA